MTTKKVKKVLKFPKTVYLNWDDREVGPNSILVAFQTLEEFSDGMSTEDISGEYIAIYELKSVNLLEVKPTLTPVR